MQCSATCCAISSSSSFRTPITSKKLPGSCNDRCVQPSTRLLLTESPSLLPNRCHSDQRQSAIPILVHSYCLPVAFASILFSEISSLPQYQSRHRVSPAKDSKNARLLKTKHQRLTQSNAINTEVLTFQAIDIAPLGIPRATFTRLSYQRPPIS